MRSAKPLTLSLIVLAALLFGTLSPIAAQDGGNILIMARAADTTGLDPHTQTAFASGAPPGADLRAARACSTPT